MNSIELGSVGQSTETTKVVLLFCSEAKQPNNQHCLTSLQIPDLHSTVVTERVCVTCLSQLQKTLPLSLTTHYIAGLDRVSTTSTICQSCLSLFLEQNLSIFSLGLFFLIVSNHTERERERERDLEMATFAGTTQKCKACDKTVYLVDQLTADNKVYHKACFRCHHCKGTLKLSNYSSFEGVLYCKPHFDQLFKMTGSLDKSFESAPKTVRVDRSGEGHANSKASSMFAGTQDKCVACKKTVYPIEKVAVDGVSYHKPCFKCVHGGCVISPSNYVAHEHRLYCRHHHTQLFKEKGNFSQLDHSDHSKGVTENTVQESG